MTYKEALDKHVLASAITVFNGDKCVNCETAFSVAKLKSTLNGIAQKFDAKIKDIVKELKPTDYDIRADKYRRLHEIETREKAHDGWNGEGEEPERPSEEELKDAEGFRTELEGFEHVHADFVERVNLAYSKIAEEDCGADCPSITRNEWCEIYEVMKGEGVVEVYIDGAQLTREQFLNVLIHRFVKE